MCLKGCSQGERICGMQVALASFGEINKKKKLKFRLHIKKTEPGDQNQTFASHFI